LQSKFPIILNRNNGYSHDIIYHLSPLERTHAYILLDTKLCGYLRKYMSESLHPREQGVIVRNTQEDIPKIVNLQKESFPYLARYGNIWHPEELESHLRIFPQ
jgi:hypothetical protein